MFIFMILFKFSLPDLIQIGQEFLILIINLLISLLVNFFNMIMRWFDLSFSFRKFISGNSINNIFVMSFEVLQLNKSLCFGHQQIYYKFINMTQQIVVNIQKYYPFGEIQQIYLKNRTCVRKIILYSNKQQYNQLKEKIEVVKSLKHNALIKLINVLEGTNQFYLFYEYVQNKYQNSKLSFKRDSQMGFKQKLIELSLQIADKKIVTQIDFKNVGYDKQEEIKYYLDIDSLRIIQNPQNSIKNAYIMQINKIFTYLLEQSQNLQESYFVDTTRDHKTPNRKQSDNKKQVASNHFKTSINCGESDENTENVRNKISSLEALNRIQQKINELKFSAKKYNPNNFKSKQNLRETVKESWKAQKLDTRKMSGQTIYDSYFHKNHAHKEKTPVKLKNSTIKQEEANETQVKESKRYYNENKSPERKKIVKNQFKEKDPFFHKPISTPQKQEFLRKSSLKCKKQPVSKKDFDDIKKHQFQNFYKSKASYVQQFLGLLGDSIQESKRSKNDDYFDNKSSRDNINKKYKDLVIDKPKPKNKSKEFFDKKDKLIISTDYNTPETPLGKQKMVRSTTSIVQKNVKNDKKNFGSPEQKNYYTNLNEKNFKKKQLLTCKSETQLIDQGKSYSHRDSHKNQKNIKEKISKALKQGDTILKKIRKDSLFSAYVEHKKK